MTLDKTQLLMYTAVVPYTVASLMGVASAPKTITPTTPTLTERTYQIQETNLARELADLVDTTRDRLPTEWTKISHGSLKYSRNVSTQSEQEYLQLSANAYFDKLFLFGPSPDDRYVSRNNVFTFIRDNKYTSLELILAFNTLAGSGPTHQFYDVDLDGKIDGFGTIYFIANSQVYPTPMLVSSSQQNPRGFSRDKMSREELKIRDEQFEDSLRRGSAAVRDYLKLPPQTVKPLR